MSSSVNSPLFSDARIHPRVSRSVLFVSLLGFSLSLFAAAPLVTESAGNTMIFQATEQSGRPASTTVAVDQGMPGAQPVMVRPDLVVLDTAASVSESGLELEQSSGESTAMSETAGVANQQRQDQQAGLTSGVGRVADGQHLFDSVSQFRSADDGGLRLAIPSADVPAEPGDNVGGLSTRHKDQATKPLVAVVNQAGEGAELQPIPIAVVLALIALIGLVPISRRRVTHT